MNMQKALIISAHPDDDILGCGGIMSKYAHRGTVFRVVFIAEGTSCRFSGAGSSGVAEERKFREDCARDALGIFGINGPVFYNLPCGRLDTIPLIEIGKIVENEIRQFAPDAIFTHSSTDVNNDHRLVLQAVLQATRPGALSSVAVVYSYEVLSSTEWRFEETFSPDVFVKLEEADIETKVRAIRQYVSELRQLPFPRSEDGIKILAQYRGMQAGFLYAEAFKLLRQLII